MAFLNVHRGKGNGECYAQASPNKPPSSSSPSVMWLSFFINRNFLFKLVVALLVLRGPSDREGTRC